MAGITGESADRGVPGSIGRNTGDGGDGVWGEAQPTGRGVVGVTAEGSGVWGHVTKGRGVVGLVDDDEHGTGVWGEVKKDRGVVGVVQVDGAGVWGHAQKGRGVVGVVVEDGTGCWGEVKDGRGVVGVVNGGRPDGTGVWGEVKAGTGVVGVANDTGVGVSGRCDAGDGVVGTGRRGVVGISETFQGVYGKSGDNAGVVGESDRMHAVFAITHSPSSAGVYATNTHGGQAALFEGNVTVTGDLILAGADVAEEFEVVDRDVPAGSVLVLDPNGRLVDTTRPYDTRVAGIVSGAGDRVPALVLDRAPGGTHAPRAALAVAGKAWCLADAETGPIAVGDLLTTSRRPGHAMVATDRLASIGAVIGKALTPLPSGTGSVLVLVGLR